MVNAKETYDLVIYGATSAGIAAAIQAGRMGLRTVVLEPGDRIGGLTAGGLGDTDHGQQDAIGGIAREFYQRVGRKYGEEDAVWYFEPGIALEVFQEMLSEQDVTVIHGERLDRTHGDAVTMDGNAIRQIRMESGRTFEAKMFMDAGYEGDLMALAGVSYTVGREPNDRYGETRNGIRSKSENELPDGIDPYLEPGKPASGLLPRVNPNPGGMPGEGDRKLQAYCYRMCLTDDPRNRIMIARPEGYDERDYEILFRALEAGMPHDRVFKLNVMRNRKTDSNNHYGISCDYNGGNHAYPEADYDTRAAIAARHVVYQKGLVWTIQNHPRVPREARERYAPWGLPKDEFVETGNWTPQLYIRESRRMCGDYTVTENVVLRRDTVADSVGLGSYAMDSHHTQYYVNDRGFVSTEGGFYDILESPYPVSYRALVPKRTQCTNLLVPVCLSATHAAYGSIRMEPVFMILAQSAATAAALAIETGRPVQDVDMATLRTRLEADGQIL